MKEIVFGLLLLIQLVFGDNNTTQNNSLESNETNNSTVTKPINLEAFKGSWIHGVQDYGQDLRITKVKNDSFTFELYTMAGQNVGSIEGIAHIIKDKIMYSDSEGCELEFILNDNILTINATDDCSGYGGMNTYFGGDFKIKK
jgi:hypothetical protein